MPEFDKDRYHYGYKDCLEEVRNKLDSETLLREVEQTIRILDLGDIPCAHEHIMGGNIIAKAVIDKIKKELIT